MVSFGKSESKSESTPQRVENWNASQKALFEQLFSTASGNMSSPVVSYPGQMSVPQTDQESSYFNAINQAYSPANLSVRSQAINDVLSGKPAYEINPETTEQFYQEGVKPGYMKEWEDVVLPQIKSSYVGPGYWGSARAYAETEGAKDLATTLAQKRAELYYQDEQARRAGLESAAGRQATLAGSATDSLSGATTQLGTAGQYARSIAQEKVQGDLQRWLMGEEVGGVANNAYNPYVQLALALMGLTPFTIANQSQSKSDSFGGSFNLGIGGGGTGGKA